MNTILLTAQPQQFVFDPTINIALIVSVVTLLASILSPILLAYINSRHSIKMYRLEILEKYTYTALENYLNMLSLYLSHMGNSDLARYKESLSIVMLYADEHSIELMLQLDRLIDSRSLPEARELVPKVSLSIRKQLSLISR